MIRVLGIGENTVDRYVRTGLMYPGGSQLNFALYAHKLKVYSAYMGVFGSDYAGDFLKGTLTKIGVDISRCKTIDGANGYCDVEITNGGERKFPDWDPGVSKSSPLSLSKEDLVYMNTFSLVHTGYAAFMDDQLQLYQNREFLLIYDFSTIDCIQESELLKNIAPKIDLALFSCAHMGDENVDILIKNAHEEGTKYILATMGKRGQIFYDGGNRYFGNAKSIAAKDTLGAGDAFITAFAISMLQNGWSKYKMPSSEVIQHALSKASEFAADICLIDGAVGYPCRMDISTNF